MKLQRVITIYELCDLVRQASNLGLDPYKFVAATQHAVKYHDVTATQREEAKKMIHYSSFSYPLIREALGGGDWRFWIVMADRPKLEATVRHPDREIAKSEALRLANKVPDTRFFVAAVTGVACAEKENMVPIGINWEEMKKPPL